MVVPQAIREDSQVAEWVERERESEGRGGGEAQEKGKMSGGRGGQVERKCEREGK